MQSPTASPQGIASLYMGNPGALQQKVKKDQQQAKPGLPPDLRDLMALDIVTNEQDAAKRQAAMSALNKMSPAGQEPPTVAQSLQEQAKQKLQAQMLMQQRQQAMQGGLAGAQMAQAQQPQGLDGADVDVGEFAGGGIVSFAKGDKVDDTYETPYDRRNRLIREQEARDAENAPPLDPQAAADRAALGQLWGALRGGSESAGRAIADIASLIPRGLVGAYDSAVVRPMRAAGVNAAYLSPKLVPEGVDPASMTPFTDVARKREAEAAARPAAPLRETKGDQEGDYPMPSGVRRAPPVPKASPVASRPAAPAAGLPTAAKAAPTPTSPLQAAYDKYLEKALTGDREAARQTARDQYEREVGKADTSQYDRLIAELENRKGQLNAPAKGFDAFSEYMAQIANAGPQRNWYEAGAKGAAAQTALNKERQAQQFELTKQGVEIAQKKLDTERAYKKELYTTAEAEAKRIDELAKDAAKEFGLDARNERTLANQIKVQLLQNQGTLAAANVRATAGGGADKQQLAELKSLQASLQNQLKTEFRKDQRTAINAQLAQVNAAIAQMAGLGTMGGAPGAAGPGGTPTGWGKASVVNP